MKGWIPLLGLLNPISCYAEAPMDAQLRFQELELTLIDGRSLDYSDLKGKVVLLLMWRASVGTRRNMRGCKSCMRRKKDLGFVIVGFPATSSGGRNVARPRKFSSFVR